MVKTLCDMASITSLSLKGQYPTPEYLQETFTISPTDSLQVIAHLKTLTRQSMILTEDDWKELDKPADDGLDYLYHRD